MAARVHDRLAGTFGSQNVFMDVDNLMAGQRFDRELEKALADTDVFLAVIGPRWMELFEKRLASGERDYVREEIAGALRRGLVVIPVLIERPSLPRADALPEDVRELVLYQKQDVTHEQFGRDIQGLVEAIRFARRAKTGPRLPKADIPWALILATAASVLVIGWVGAHQAGLPVWWSSPKLPDASLVPTQKDLEGAAMKAILAEQEKLKAEAEAKRQAEAEDRKKAQAVTEAARLAEQQAAAAEAARLAEQQAAAAEAARLAEQQAAAEEAARLAALRVVAAEAEQERSKAEEASRQAIDPNAHPFKGKWGNSNTGCNGNPGSISSSVDPSRQLGEFGPNDRRVTFGFETATYIMPRAMGFMCVNAKIEYSAQLGYQFSARCRDDYHKTDGEILLRGSNHNIDGTGPDGFSLQLEKCR